MSYTITTWADTSLKKRSRSRCAYSNVNKILLKSVAATSVAVMNIRKSAYAVHTILKGHCDVDRGEHFCRAESCEIDQKSKRSVFTAKESAGTDSKKMSGSWKKLSRRE